MKLIISSIDDKIISIIANDQIEVNPSSAWMEHGLFFDFTSDSILSFRGKKVQFCSLPSDL